MQEPDPAIVERFRAMKHMVERLHKQEAGDGPRVRSPDGWRVLDDLNPGGRDPSVGWIPENADALALTWELPLWRRIWARLLFWTCERSTRAWMWYHGYYSVEPAKVSPRSGPPPEDEVGVREPRRPSPSAGSMAAGLFEDDVAP